MARRGDLFKAVGSVAFWSFLLWADFFGVESAAQKASFDLFQRVFSPHYPTDNQDRLYVVLIEDQDLPLSGEGSPSWPPDYADHAALLDALAGSDDYRPAGVFFDTLFENVPSDPGAVDLLCTEAAEISAAGVPVIFAQLPDFGRESAPIPRALQLCRTPVETAAVGWRAPEGLYPFAVTIAGETIPTAAAALYAIALENQAAVDREAAAGFNEKGADGPAMRTLWGATSPAIAGCTNYRGDFGTKFLHSARIFISGFFPHRRLRQDFEYPQRCSFHAVKSARDILSLSPEERDYLAAELDNAFVLVGVNVDGIPDFVDSPVHGRLPGVFMHAMALDNMLTSGPRFLRDSPKIPLPFGGLSLGVDAVVQTLLLLGLALALAGRGGPGDAAGAGHSGHCPRGRWAIGLAYNAAAFTLFGIVVAATVTATFLYLDWTPINYGGVLLVAAGMVFSKNPSDSAPRRR